MTSLFPVATSIVTGSIVAFKSGKFTYYGTIVNALDDEGVTEYEILDSLGCIWNKGYSDLTTLEASLEARCIPYINYSKLDRHPVLNALIDWQTALYQPSRAAAIEYLTGCIAKAAESKTDVKTLEEAITSFFQG